MARCKWLAAIWVGDQILGVDGTIQSDGFPPTREMTDGEMESKAAILPNEASLDALSPNGQIPRRSLTVI